MFQSSFQTKISLFLSIHKKHFMRFYCVKNMKVCHSSSLNDLCHLHKIWELHKNAHCTMMLFFPFSVRSFTMCLSSVFMKDWKNLTLDSGSNIPHRIKVPPLEFYIKYKFCSFLSPKNSTYFFFQKMILHSTMFIPKKVEGEQKKKFTTVL